MQATGDLTSTQWQIADAIARQLVLNNTDVNEFRKTIAYLRAYLDREDAGKKFFIYLNTLVRHGNSIGHSQRTSGYFRSIEEICKQYLDTYQDTPQTALYILGWAARLMQYYKEAGPIGEIPELSIQSEREAEIQAVTAAQTFHVGQQLEATVTGVKGNKVTYEILGAIRLTAKEPKKASSLSEGQAITVEVVALKDDGGLKSVKCID